MMIAPSERYLCSAFNWWAINIQGKTVLEVCTTEEARSVLQTIRAGCVNRVVLL